MKKLYALLVAVCALSVAGCGPEDGEYTFRILSTSDVHGRYFDKHYLTDETVPSLMSVAWYIDTVRVANGAENVFLIDAGDCLHGDNASYYYNYVDTTTEHVYARMLEYLGYDAWVPGNHDIETGHPVYDRIAETLEVPILASNAIRTDNGKPYFGEYVIEKRHGLKFAIIGFTQPNIKNAYAPELWEGMDFESLIPDFTQNVVDRVRAEEDPDVVIVVIHSGAGRGDGAQLEQQGLDLFNSLEGVDYIVSSHDHKAAVYESEKLCMANTGNYCANLAYGTITLKVENGKVVDKKISAELIALDKDNVDKKMKAAFQSDYEAVKGYVTKEVGVLKSDMNTRDALFGMSDYVNLLHTVCLEASGVQVSFAAPVTTNAVFKAGKIIYNDLMTLYSYDNPLYVVKMSGKEIKDYLEHSYDGWINTQDRKAETLLKMREFKNPRTGQQMWFFMGQSYNLDSAGGLVYEVDVTKPMGERIVIRSFADGAPFDMASEYQVAMNSYRALGGADLMKKAGIDTGEIDARVVAVHADIRSLLNDYIVKKGAVDSAEIGDRSVIGYWDFVPEKKARKALERDMERMTPMRF